MVNRATDFIKNNQWLIVAFLILAVVRIWYVAQPSPVWWDTSIYIGMGKYIFSGGHLGLWEPFRPILWPIIQGAVWRVGIDPLVFGKIFVLLSSFVAMAVVYVIGFRMEGKKTGILAMVLLGITPVFFYFTNVQITDISSLAVGLVGVLLFSRKHYFASGLVVGLAFALRFPQGLIIVALGFAAIFNTLDFQNLKHTFKASFLKLLALAVGFSVILVPYLVFNYIRYQDILLSFKLATSVLVGDLLYLYDGGAWFYALEVFKQNWFSILALAGVAISFTQFKQIRRNETTLAVLFSFMLLFAYLTYQPHKEVRYAIAFLPYLFLMAGFGLVFIYKKTPKSFSRVGMYAIAVALAYFVYSHRGDMRSPIFSKETVAFESYFENHGYVRIVTTSPLHVVYGEVRILQLYETWEAGIGATTWLHSDIDYITLDTGQIFCKNGISECLSLRNTFLSALNKEGVLEYTQVLSGGRELFIYRMKKQ